MNNAMLALYWGELPTGKENAVTYLDLCRAWEKTERAVRTLLHELSRFDSGDDFILIRSSATKGFYKTDDLETIKAYKQECLNKGRSVFAPVHKINRVLNAANKAQYSLHNNLRLYREYAGLKQTEVCAEMQLIYPAFDASLLSKMENSLCLPTFDQLVHLAAIYRCEPNELLDMKGGV